VWRALGVGRGCLPGTAASMGGVGLQPLLFAMVVVECHACMCAHTLQRACRTLDRAPQRPLALSLLLLRRVGARC
jgi:hypothetical protein